MLARLFLTVLGLLWSGGLAQLQVQVSAPPEAPLFLLFINIPS